MGCSGSGKTTVANIIRALGYPVIDCDKVYRDMLFDDNVINQIKQIIPGAFFNKKIICFKQVGLFFEHNKSLEMKFEEWRQQYFRKKLYSILNNVQHLVFIDLPIFYNGRLFDDFDCIIYIKSYHCLCKQRIAKRNNYSAKKIDYLIKRSSFQPMGAQVIIIRNDGSFVELNDKIQLLLQALAC